MNENCNQLWESRYRNLEDTLEQIILASKVSMEELSSKNELHGMRIRTARIVEIEGVKYVVCVADGENLEFRFEFVRSGSVIKNIKFQRSNTYPIPATLLKASSAEVNIHVRSNLPELHNKIIHRKVRL